MWPSLEVASTPAEECVAEGASGTVKCEDLGYTIKEKNQLERHRGKVRSGAPPTGGSGGARGNTMLFHNTLH